MEGGLPREVRREASYRFSTSGTSRRVPTVIATAMMDAASSGYIMKPPAWKKDAEIRSWLFPFLKDRRPGGIVGTDRGFDHSVSRERRFFLSVRRLHADKELPLSARHHG